MNNRSVALIGLDGSGKSANLNLMKNDPQYKGYSFLWVRWSPFLLKPFYLLLDKKQKEPSSNARKSGKNERKEINQIYLNKKQTKQKIFGNSIIRRVWLFLATVDYIIQYYKKSSSILLKRRNVIYDRFYLDLYIDQGLNFGYSKEQIAIEVEKHRWLFPKVDKYVYIRVKPEVCYERKDDIPNMEYLTKRYEIYEYLAQKEKWIIVDGEQPLNKVYLAIKRQVLE